MKKMIIISQIYYSLSLAERFTFIGISMLVRAQENSVVSIELKKKMLVPTA